mmetsp:Transcript_27541/g.32344  ORF Transcript_27541/g.32344 Transcript_27541/m.32344 type:complete len:238 (+) Transcript_27541:1086-1799(+)
MSKNPHLDLQVGLRGTNIIIVSDRTITVVGVHQVHRPDQVVLVAIVRRSTLREILDKRIEMILIVNHPRIELCKLKVLRVPRTVREPDALVRSHPLHMVTLLNVTVSNATDVLVVNVRGSDETLLIVMLANVGDANGRTDDPSVRIVIRQIALAVNGGAIQVSLVTVNGIVAHARGALWHSGRGIDQIPVQVLESEHKHAFTVGTSGDVSFLFLCMQRAGHPVRRRNPDVRTVLREE